jgi:general secretion pathway protein D
MNRRTRLKTRQPFAKWALFAVGLLLIGLGTAGFDALAESASSLFKQGQQAEARDDVMAAYNFYEQAYHKDPKDVSYRTAYYRTRLNAAEYHIHQGDKFSAQGDDAGALTEYMRALEIDPTAEVAKQGIDAVRQHSGAGNSSSVGESSVQRSAGAALSEVASPVTLKPISNDPITLHMSEDSKIVYQTIGKASGINVLFDPEYNSKRIQIDLSSVSLFDALRIVGTVSGTFWRPVTSNTIFVAQNTRAKRTELDEQAVQTFYLSNAAQANDLNDIQTALRNVLANAKLYGVPSQNAIVMRATPDELLLAQKLIADLDKARPEVVVDLAVLEVNRDKLRNIGITLPQTASVTLVGNNTTTTPTTGTGTGTTSTTTTTNNLTLNSLANLNATNFAVTIGQATANLLLTDTNTKILQNPRIRATDSQKASLKIGSRIPVATGSFSNGVSSGIGVSAVQTQFQYLDVGVNIDMTPTVHYDRDVTLKLAIEISAQNGSVTISGVTEPIISQRKIDQVIRLREGEANILGGLMAKQDSRNVNGTPGLGEIPLLKYFFSSQSHEVQDDEIVFLLIPHIVRASSLSALNLQSVDTGTGSTVEIRRIPPSEIPAAIAALAKPAPAGQNATLAQGPAVGTQPIPGHTAVNAAVNAMRPETLPPATPPDATTVSLQVTPAQSTQKINSSFQVVVNLTGGQDVYSVPMQIQFDSDKLTLTNVDSGTLLGRDGQAVALVHRDDGAGGLAISASRPPGVAGVTGSGSICILTFQAKAAGDANISITRPGAKNSAQQALPAIGSQAVVHVE